MKPRRGAFGALCVLVVAGCSAAAAGPDSTPPVSGTVADVGQLPAPLESANSSVASTSTTSTTVVATTTTEFAAPGNRILMIGDSILASTTSRYRGEMCDALVPLGWQVEIEAEVNRAIEFGNEVLRARGDAGWDVGLVFLGTNYGGDEDAFIKQLERIVRGFGDIPVILVTVGEHRTELREVNDVLRGFAQLFDNVSIIDWNLVLKAAPALRQPDGIHLTYDGRQALADTVAAHVGRAPTEPGRCLGSIYTNDSAGSVDGTGSTPTTPPRSSTPSTVKPGSTTTVASTGVSTTTPGTEPPPDTFPEPPSPSVPTT